MVDASTAKEFADSMEIPYIETSAKSAYNVDETFMRMARAIKDRFESVSLRVFFHVFLGYRNQTPNPHSLPLT